MNTSGPEFSDIRVRHAGCVSWVQLYRPDVGNAIGANMLREMHQFLETRPPGISVVVLEGLDSVFCSGADFNALANEEQGDGDVATELYDLWSKLAHGPFISIANVKGKANAGGLGFIAACDIAIASENATFGLSEMLFGLIPACVLPFLNRKIGANKARYLTLTTKAIPASIARDWGLIDEYTDNPDDLLRRQLLRLKLLDITAIKRCKNYIAEIEYGKDSTHREAAIACNREVFSDADNLGKIRQYVETGRFPWEQ